MAKNKIEGVSFTPLAETFDAPGGMKVSFPCSTDEIFKLGKHFKNALAVPGVAEKFSSGDKGIYTVSKDGVIISCGEIKVARDGICVNYNRAYQNKPGSPESAEAVEAFVQSVNDGNFEINYLIEDGEFKPKSAAPSP